MATHSASIEWMLDTYYRLLPKLDTYPRWIAAVDEQIEAKHAQLARYHPDYAQMPSQGVAAYTGPAATRSRVSDPTWGAFLVMDQQYTTLLLAVRRLEQDRQDLCADWADTRAFCTRVRDALAALDADVQEELRKHHALHIPVASLILREDCRYCYQTESGLRAVFARAYRDLLDYLGPHIPLRLPIDDCRTIARRSSCVRAAEAVLSS